MAKRIAVNENGFSLVEIIIILIIVGILASVAFAQFVSFSEASKTAACHSNQISIETAQTLYYAENYLEGNGAYAENMEDLIPYFANDRTPVCPKEGEYQILSAGRAACSLPEHQRN